MLAAAAVILAIVVPVALDRAMGAAKQAGECRILRILDADRYRVTCDIVGRQTVRLLGADTPAALAPQCWAEFQAGMRAKWAVRARLWSASEVDVSLDGFGWRDAPLAIVEADEERLSGWLVAENRGRIDDGYGRGGWCSG